MIIDPQKMKAQALPHFKGGEGELLAHMFCDEQNRILFGELAPGASIGMHRHDNGCEVIYIIEGTGTAQTDEGPEPLAAGVCHYCPKGHAHSVQNTGDAPLRFFAAVVEQ